MTNQERAERHEAEASIQDRKGNKDLANEHRHLANQFRADPDAWAHPLPKGPQVTYQHCSEFEVHHFVTDASDLGLPPGPFPHRLSTDMGNGQPFNVINYKKNDDGDITCVIYRQEFGCIDLHVLND